LASLFSVTVVNSALVSVSANSLGLNDSLDSIASLDHAFVMVDNLDLSVAAVSTISVARINSACISVVARLENVCASSRLSIATVNSAWVVVVAINCRVDASELNVTLVGGAWVVVVTRDW